MDKSKFITIGILIFVVGLTLFFIPKAIFNYQIDNFGTKLTNQVPKLYSQNEAMENGDITPSNITSEQLEKINQFIENVKNKKPDFIRFVQFTSKDETETVITEYQFNGKLIYYRYDSTRDTSGQHVVINEDGKQSAIVEDYCKKIEKKIKPWKGTFITKCIVSEYLEF
ncbi:DUF4362 domain-containing protein [Lysinibacillus sp. 54212]|uniref:DUF4362 domain-containing protein n=1 Tax=Lysinibacillus sp. 54212 TaxID=3119829 RepID=UPI002FC653FA